MAKLSVRRKGDWALPPGAVKAIRDARAEQWARIVKEAAERAKAREESDSQAGGK